jgi:hypothetical protein
MIRETFTLLRRSFSFINYEPGFLLPYLLSALAILLFFFIVGDPVKLRGIYYFAFLAFLTIVFLPSIASTVLKAERYDKGGIEIWKALAQTKKFLLNLGIASILLVFLIGTVTIALTLLLSAIMFYTVGYFWFIAEILEGLVRIYLVSKFILYAPICIFEGKGIRSIIASWKLTRGKMLKIFLVVFILFVIGGSLKFIPYIGYIGKYFLSLLLAAPLFIFSTLLYLER